MLSAMSAAGGDVWTSHFPSSVDLSVRFFFVEHLPANRLMLPAVENQVELGTACPEVYWVRFPGSGGGQASPAKTGNALPISLATQSQVWLAMAS